MRVLVCPDKFRGTLTARQAADAIARGWRRARPSDVLVLEPLADGGEGTLDALVPDADPDPGFRRIELRATGPDGDPLDAEAGVRGRTGVVEMARASGLQLLTQARWDPCRTTSRGTGDLMRASSAARITPAGTLPCSDCSSKVPSPVTTRSAPRIWSSNPTASITASTPGRKDAPQKASNPNPSPPAAPAPGSCWTSRPRSRYTTAAR